MNINTFWVERFFSKPKKYKKVKFALSEMSWIHTHTQAHTHTLTCISLSPYLEGCLLPWLFLRSFFSSAWHFSRLSPLLLCSIWYFFSAAWGGQHKVSRGKAVIFNTWLVQNLDWRCTGYFSFKLSSLPKLAARHQQQTCCSVFAGCISLLIWFPFQVEWCLVHNKIRLGL